MKNITQSLKVIVLALTLSFGLSYVYAWTAPTVSPPNGNVEAPLNTGTALQGKNGPLGVNGVFHGYSNAYFDGNVQIKATDPWGVSMIVTNLSGGANTWRLVSGGASGDGNVPAGGMAIHHDGNNSPIQIKNDGTVFMNAGNVGVGTPSPTRKLVAASPSAMKLANANGALFSDVANDGGVIVGSDFLIGSIQGTNAAGTSAKNLMLQNEGGNVGIGTPSPQAKLDVAGGIRPMAATVGVACSLIGVQAYDSATGAPLYCDGTVWTAAGGVPQGTLAGYCYYYSAQGLVEKAWPVISSTLCSTETVCASGWTYKFMGSGYWSGGNTYETATCMKL